MLGVPTGTVPMGSGSGWKIVTIDSSIPAITSVSVGWLCLRAARVFRHLPTMAGVFDDRLGIRLSVLAAVTSGATPTRRHFWQTMPLDWL